MIEPDRIRSGIEPFLPGDTEALQILQRVKIKPLPCPCLLPGQKYGNMVIAECSLEHGDIISHTAEHRQGLGG